MDLTVIIYGSIFLVFLIPGTIIIHRKHDWMITHVYCPPEIMFFETSEERGRMHNQAIIAFVRRPITWILVLSYPTLAALIVNGLKWPIIAWCKALSGNNEINKFLFVAFMMIPICCAVFLPFWHGRRWTRKYFRTYLNEHGTPICMNCGYDLRGLEEHRCPECGKTF